MASTKRERLQATLHHAQETWNYEKSCAPKNAVNETAWSIQVVEPVLHALDWPRLLRRHLSGTGAFFEWPGKHQVDLALLEDGIPRAFLELKNDHAGCRRDLKRKIVKHPELRSCHLAGAAWFATAPGFCLYEVRADGSMVPGPSLELNDERQTVDNLASLAAPVLLGKIGVADWLQSFSPTSDPIFPRCRPRTVQCRFFELLRSKLGLGDSVETRYQCLTFEPPTPTYAYSDLPGILPLGEGIVFSFDSTMNQFQCDFYKNENRKVGGTRKWSFDESGIDDGVLRAFIDEYLLPEIKRRQSIR
jgi:hypothetical protein